MRPKQQQKARHDDLFRARLDQIINMKHELVTLADKIDWAWLDEQLAGCFAFSFIAVMDLVLPDSNALMVSCGTPDRSDRSRDFHPRPTTTKPP